MIHLIALTLASFSTVNAHASIEHDQYTKLFPTHAEYCSLSQIKPVGAAEGGPGGHAILYVEGLCKDYSVNYPRVIPCKNAKIEKQYAHTGVGISVDNDYRNINWVVVPGYDLFTHGITPTPGVVNQAAMDAVVTAATSKRVYEGVRFNTELVSPEVKQPDYQKQVARATIGTDIAVQFGRDMECVRFPLPEAKIKAIADFLNEVNRPYVQNEKVYEWSGYHNNCAMLSANALAQSLVRDEIPVNESAVRQILDIGLPRNGLTTLQDIVHFGGLNWIEFKFDQLDKKLAGMGYNRVHGDKLRWKSLKELESIPTGFGGLSSVYNVYPENDFYISKGLINKYIPHKKIGAYHLSQLAFEKPEYTELKASAKYWLDIYQRALDESSSKKNTDDRKLYESYLLREIKRIQDSKLLK